MKRQLLIAAFAFATALHAADDDNAYFEAKVLPLLQKRCYECHSHEKKIKGGLALDSRSGWEHGGDNGRAIEPGDVEKSLLIKAVRYTDSELQMPTKGKLPAEEIAILEQWVKQGAADPRVTVAAGKKRGIDLEKGRKFWAFQPVADPKPPAVKNKAWPLDPVDRFTLAKLERAKLRPVTDADRYTWLRRVSLDLAGLPPTPAEITEFIDDRSPQAFEKVADRLLNSKAFGERWATWKEPDGIVVVDYNWCIGCRYCEAACPYHARRFNWSKPQIPAAEINPVQGYLSNRIRPQGVMEKCTFCLHRTRNGKLPACLEACPTGARVFGNLLDPDSEIRWVLQNKRVFVLKEELGTKPQFFYFFDA